MTSPDASSTGPVGERAARRRSQRGSSARSRALIAGAATLGLLAVGGTGWAMTQGSGKATTTANTSTSTSPSTSTAPGSSDTSPSDATSPPSTSTSPSATGSTATSPAVPAAFAACKSEVTTGDALAKVSGTMAAHWRDHTSAQFRVDKGEISASQAQAVWARTKAAGPSDISKFEAASTAYDKNKGACAGMGQVPPKFADAASKCKQHASANAKVANSIGPIAAAWDGHQGDMKSKSDTPVGPYMQKWRGQVSTAPQAVKKYDSAAAALRNSPGCSVAS